MTPADSEGDLDREERPNVGSEIERALSQLRPGDTPEYRRKHPLDRGPNEGEPLTDDDGEPWSNL